MKRIVVTAILLAASIMVTAAQPAKEPYKPGLGEFMTATQDQPRRRDHAVDALLAR